MSIRNYATWSRKYVTTFGMDKPTDLQMAALWEPVFEASGYSCEELDYALQMIARNPPEYRSEHLRKIHEVIGEQRRRESCDLQAAQDAVDGFEACKLCLSSGIVVVPHIRYVTNGVWNTYPGRTWKPIFGVSCRCDLGRRVSACPRRVMLMTLDKYDGLNPGWERQMVAEQKAKAAQRQANQVAKEMDQELGPLLSAIGAMPEDEVKAEPMGRQKPDYWAPNSHWTKEDQERWPHLRKPGPQPENQIAGTFEEQLARARKGRS